MNYSKRDFLKAGALGAGSMVLAPALLNSAWGAGAENPAGNKTPPATFQPLPPISPEERKLRVAKAQKLMREAGIGALLAGPARQPCR